MLQNDPHKSMFDSLGDTKFHQLVEQLIVREFGGSIGFVASSLSGPDQGIDASHIREETSIPDSQFKFHEVAGADGSRIRSVAMGEFKEWITEKCGANDTGVYLFATNVARTTAAGGDKDRFTEIIEGYPNATIYYWDYDQLRFLLNKPENSDLVDEYLSVHNSEQIRQQENQLAEERAQLAAREKEVYVREPEFASASQKFKTQFIDWKLLADVYHAFVYLVEPVYEDDHDEVRKTIRALFQIDEDMEKQIKDTLIDEGRLDITGNVITANEVEKAMATASDMLDLMGPELEKVISLIQRATS